MAAKAEAAREQARDVTRNQIRVEDGRAQARGRDGELLFRKHVGGHTDDKFALPKEMEEDPDWSYQWMVVTVTGMPDVSAVNSAFAQGWRPVKAERCPGLFMPNGYSGDIVVDGLGLFERPMSLTLEARAEERNKAMQQMRDQRAQLDLKRGMPGGHVADGISTDSIYQGAGPAVRTSVAPEPGAMKPVLAIDPA